MKKRLRFTVYGLRFTVCTIIIGLALVIQSCKKEKSMLYETNTADVSQEGGSKTNVKSTVEFISIAYTDIFGKEIANTKLVNLSTAYFSFGDKKLVEDMIIRNFLNDTDAKIPTMKQMRDNVPQFVADTYKKLLNRNPNEFEKFYISNIIESDTSVSPVVLYYGIMTCNEYRYY